MTINLVSVGSMLALSEWLFFKVDLPFTGNRRQSQSGRNCDFISFKKL